MAGNSTDAGRSVTQKITAILMAFTEGSEHSLTEIAHLAALPVSTAHRLTTELVSCHLLIRTANGRYRTGPPLRGMGAAEVRPPNLRERAPCVLEDLAAATGYRARLGVLQELQVAYIEKHPGPRPTSTFLSAATLPAHATALGRVLLAFAPPGMIELTITRGLRAYTQHTITSPALLRRALALTRATRVAVTRCELEVSTCTVAVPVLGPGGGVLAAIELTVPDLGRELRAVLGVLAIAARSLSRELTGALPAPDQMQARAGADRGLPGPDPAQSCPHTAEG
jgi:DNA-binding IclR family transcriptional regulator